MQSIKIYLLPLFLFIFINTQGFAQNNINEQKTVPERISKTDSVLIYGYFTEEDYNKRHNIKAQQNNSNDEIYYGDEQSKEERKKRKRDRFFGEEAAEVVVEVVVNTLFVIATFWY